MRKNALAAVLAVLVVGCAAAANPAQAPTPTRGPCFAVAGTGPSPRDEGGALVGESRDTTTIRLWAPGDHRAGTEHAIRWRMTGGGPWSFEAFGADGSRTVPRTIRVLGSDEFEATVVFPSAGCWRLNLTRAGGKLSGDVWLIVR